MLKNRKRWKIVVEYYLCKSDSEQAYLKYANECGVGKPLMNVANISESLIRNRIDTRCNLIL